MDLSTVGTLQPAAVVVIDYALVVSAVAIVAAVHPDPHRRADAREVLRSLTRINPR